MKQLYTSIALIFTLSISIQNFGQQQLPNMDFENWTTYTVGVDNPPNEFQDAIPYDIDSLTGGVWGSGNTLIDTLDDATIDLFLKDTSYSYSGNHAALLRTQMIGPLPATGTLWTGFIGKLFDLNGQLFGAKTGIDFTDTPSNYKGYFDYKSVNGDSCRIECHMTKWNTSTNKRDTVGTGEFWTDQTTSGFQPFDVEIVYNSPSPQVDTVILVMLSSYGGVEFRGVEGSTLIIDSTFFAYDPITVSNEELNTLEANIGIYSNNSSVYLNAEKSLQNLKLEIFDINGRLLFSKHFDQFKNERIDLNVSQQYVIVNVSNQQTQFNQKLFIKP